MPSTSSIGESPLYCLSGSVFKGEVVRRGIDGTLVVRVEGGKDDPGFGFE